MPRAKLTVSTVKAARPGGADTFLWDPDLRGFGLKITPRGVKIYVLQYRTGGRGSPTKRYTIGRHGSPWTPTTARDEAERLLLLIKQGNDPHAAERQRQRNDIDLNFEKYADRYLKQHGRHWSSRTRPTVECNFKNWIKPALKGKSLPSISRSDIVAMLDRIEEKAPGRVALTRNVYAHARKLFSWALSRGDIERHPFQGLEPPRTTPARERVLSDDEIVAVWRATKAIGFPFGPMLRLLILTGQRREEVAALEWSEVNRTAREWQIPPHRAKNGKSHCVPLSLLAIIELDLLAGGADWPRRGLVFSTTGRTPASGHSRAKHRLDAAIDATAKQSKNVEQMRMEPWRVHDLRRTFATGLQRLGVRLEVTEACLNHVSGSRRGIVGVYQRYQWTDEKRQALEAWGAHIERIVAARK